VGEKEIGWWMIIIILSCKKKLTEGRHIINAGVARAVVRNYPVTAARKLPVYCIIP